jgi:predicted molibdopterin-dependent oxidoreductase YjgC
VCHVQSPEAGEAVGANLPAPAGPDVVTGRARYTFDVDVPGALYLKVLRSPHAHARIVAIDDSAALAVPGVRLVLTQHDAPRRLYEDGVFETGDGRAQLLPTAWEPFPEQPSEQFPFVLNTGRTVEHWHTRTKTGKVPILERLSPTAWVEMNPRDARALRLKPQDRVDVVSRRGRVHGVELRVTETVAPGQLFVPFHYPEQNANQMTQSAFDPFSREPNYKQSAVRVEAATRESGRRVRRAAFELPGTRRASSAADRRSPMPSTGGPR